MRKHLVWVLGLALTLLSAGVAYGVPNIQNIDVKVKPTKLPKKERAPISLNVNVNSTNPGNPEGIPNSAALALVDLDKDVLFQQKGFPTCDPNQFGASSTIQDVKDACPDAIVGTGTATVVVPGGAGVPTVTIPAQTISANVKGNKLLLHTFNSVSGGTPLIGKFVKSTGGSKYGQMLRTQVPPLAGGAAKLTQFGLNVKKITYRFKKKKRALISSKCSDGKLDFQARFTDDQGQLATGTDTVKCKKKG